MNGVILHLLPGIAQATSVTLLGYPLDTGMYPNSIECIKQTYKHEGAKAFYRGISIPLVSHIVKRAYQFPLYEHLASIGFNTFLAGCLAGATGTIIGNPLQVIKVNTQASTRQENANAYDFTKKYYKKNGFLGFYRGVKITLFKDSLFGGSFLGTYGLLRDIMGPKRDSFSTFLVGALSHCLTWFLFIPVDFLKTSMQKSTGIETTRSILVNTIKKEGVLYLWKGVIPACIRTGPVSGVGMVCYEWTKKYVTDSSSSPSRRNEYEGARE